MTITLIGIGTVFFCLFLLYGIFSFTGWCFTRHAARKGEDTVVAEEQNHDAPSKPAAPEQVLTIDRAANSSNWRPETGAAAAAASTAGRKGLETASLRDSGAAVGQYGSKDPCHPRHCKRGDHEAQRSGGVERSETVTGPIPAAAGATTKEITSPLPGTVLSVSVHAGDSVKRGQKVAVIEAMKMENDILSDRDGIIAKVCVTKGDTLLQGAAIVEFER